MRKQLCLLSGLLGAQLFAASGAQTAPDTAADAASTTVVALQPVATPTRGRLDLRAPKLTDVYSQATIARALSNVRDPDTIEEVEVEGTRSRELPMNTPSIPGGILAPLWALLHPTQAWRIFAPLPPDQSAAFDKSNYVRSATDPYRAPMLPPR